jgi:hypothetical protein
MKRYSVYLWMALISLLISACSEKADSSLEIELENTTAFDISDKTVNINLNDEQLKLFTDSKFITASSGSEKIPVELLKDKSQLLVQVSIPAQGKLDVKIEGVDEMDTESIKKTHAELWHKDGGEFVDSHYEGGGEFKPFKSLRVPDVYNGMSEYIKYEGPGWESDKVGHRLYLDDRNAIDIFGKKVKDIVLPGVGMDGYLSYGYMEDWGMDILKVGGSLGIGSIGYWLNGEAVRLNNTDSTYCEVLYDGNLFSQLGFNYWGWNIDDKTIDVNAFLSIKAGSRMTKYKIETSENLENLCTGIVKSKHKTELLSGELLDGWSYLATWGDQCLAGDSLGMAIFYPSGQMKALTQDEHSYVVVLSSKDKVLEYYFLAAWQQEPAGIQTLAEFEAYLKQVQAELNVPVKVTIK